MHFCERGARYLKPLTQRDVALSVGLHESTVSRATANKYVLLPTGRTIPFSDFFDGSLAANFGHARGATNGLEQLGWRWEKEKTGIGHDVLSQPLTPSAAC